MINLDNVIFNSLKNAARNIILNDSEKIYLKKNTRNKDINSLRETEDFLFSFFSKINNIYFDVEKDKDYLKELSNTVWDDIRLTKKETIKEEIGRNYRSANTNPIEINKILEDMYNEEEVPSRFEISDNVIINDNEEVYLDKNDSGNWYYLKIFNKKLN